jgi:hypothetical protein
MGVENPLLFDVSIAQLANRRRDANALAGTLMADP